MQLQNQSSQSQALRFAVACCTFLAVVTSTFAQQPGRGFNPFNANQARGPQQPGNAPNIVTADIVDAPLSTALKMISDLTGWSIILSPSLSERPPKMHFWLRNISPEDALDRIAFVANLVVQRRDNVVQLTTFDEYARLNGTDKRVITLKHLNSRDLAATLQPLVDKDQSKVLADAETNKLVLLVRQPLLDSITKLIDELDVPFEKDSVRIIKLKHVDAATLVPSLERFLEAASNSERSTLSGSSPLLAPPIIDRVPPAPGGAAPAPAIAPAAAPAGADQGGQGSRAGARWFVQFMVQRDLNVVVLRGLPADVAQTEALINQLDVSSDTFVKNYQLKYTNAREVFDTINTIVNEDQQRTRGAAARDSKNQLEEEVPRLRVALSEQNNQIVLEGSARNHERISAILDAIDRPLPPGSGGIRTYRLDNSTAEEVAAVVAAIIEQRNSSSTHAQQARSGGANGAEGPGAGDAPLGTVGSRYQAPTAEGSQIRAGPRLGQATPSAPGEGASQSASGATPSSGDILPPVVTAAPEINAVILRASAADHEEFGALIRELDKPKDQVLLEVTLVAVRSSDAFNLGVELAGATGNGPRIIGFNSFGIGSVNTATGQLSFDNPPPLGMNVGIFQSNDFSVVINALRTVGETRVTSAPRILVEDNAPGQISQLNREPYAVASQGSNSTITSFGGFAEAGTTLTVTPHVAEGDWLRLEYVVNLSSFDQRTPQQLQANLPPPIRQNQSEGVVRLPSESTVVLGGLVSTRTDDTRSSVPILGEIPIIRHLFSSQSKSKTNETLFIFIRPVLLRDLGFGDLRYLSESDIRAAQLGRPDLPWNELKMISPRPADLSKRDRNNGK